MESNQKTTVESLAGRLGGSTRDRSIGAILIDAGRLTTEAAERVLREQKAKGLRFGEAAIALGVLKESDIDFALARQFDYPYLAGGDDSISETVVAAFKPFSPIVEQLRALRSQLMVRWFNDEPEQRALAVVSPQRGEGRSVVAANLAVVFSQLGERTLLIDADMRNPAQHKLFKLDNRSGLSNILTGRAGPEAMVRIPSLLDLSVLPSGAVPPNPQELLGRPLFAKLMEEACRSFDVVIVDTPAADQAADAQLIAVRAGAALIVARKDVTPAPVAQSLATSLSQASANVVGAVLNVF